MDFFTGQIVQLGIGYAPKQTALCNGQNMPISQVTALYALIGYTFGGNPGSQVFGLPDTRGRTIVGTSRTAPVFTVGQVGGEASHALTTAEMPQHVHTMNAAPTGTKTNDPTGALPGIAEVKSYGAATGLLPLGGAPMASAGSGQDHPNMQPYLAITCAIVLYGLYPSRG